jgi:carboxypeptidase T
MVFLLFILSIDQRYHTFDEVAHELDSIASNYSAIAHLDTIGYSTLDSLPIFAMKISDNVNLDEDEPAVLYVACHHAEEILGIEICMYMIDDLISNYNIDSTKTYWVDNHEIWIVPLLNPEGHTVVMEGIDTTWRKNKRDNNNNGTFDLDYDGVDPNRNYDFHWVEGGSSDPSSEYYRGPAPFSENETGAMRDLCINENFVFCNTYHSARTGLGEVIYYPWRTGSNTSPDYHFIRQIADTMSKRIINDQGTGTYRALPGVGIDGRARNWMYGIGGTFAYCVEVSTTTIQPGWMVDGICARNLVGAYYLLDRVERSGITGCIYDSLTNEPLSAEVIIEGYYDPDLPLRRSDSKYGRYIRMLTQDKSPYDIKFKKCGYEPGYLNNIVVGEGKLTECDVYLKRIGGSQAVYDVMDIFMIYPNPTRSALVIHIEKPSQFSSLKIYDVNGRLLKIFDHPTSDIIWTCGDELNRTMSNGIYYVLGETTEQNYIKKVVIFN